MIWFDIPISTLLLRKLCLEPTPEKSLARTLLGLGKVLTEGGVGNLGVPLDLCTALTLACLGLISSSARAGPSQGRTEAPGAAWGH